MLLSSWPASSMQRRGGRVCNSSSRSSLYNSTRNIDKEFPPSPNPRRGSRPTYVAQCTLLTVTCGNNCETTRPNRPVTPFLSSLNMGPSCQTVSYAFWMSRKNAERGACFLAPSRQCMRTFRCGQCSCGQSGMQLVIHED